MYINICNLLSSPPRLLHSNAAEVTAIHKACALCLAARSLLGRVIEIVSDSKVAVSWITGKGFGNLKQVNLIYDICDNLEAIGGKVSFSPRDSNQFADMLAKLGSKMTGDFVEWGELG